MPWMFTSAFTVMALGFYLIFPQLKDSISQKELSELHFFEVVKPNIRYGINLDEYQWEENVVQKNEFFSKILLNCYDSSHDVNRLIDNTRSIFDSRKLRAGKPYLVLRSKDCSSAEFLVYEDSPYSFIKYDLNEYCAERIYKPIEKRYELVQGHIEQGSSLYKSMIDAGIIAYRGLTAKMEQALAWTVDFHHLHAGDEYSVYYEKIFVDGEEMDAGEVKAAVFKHQGKNFYAFKYDNGKLNGYYDEDGKSAKRAFLKAPVSFSRVSSRYNLRRFHPVLKRMKAHLGTDYAAPTGTPIMAVGDGVVEIAGYSGGNGNYVKIRHNKTYQTQYLHMQKFASGIRAGVTVKQGQVIGYVGSTGLATGPHVCFRFWKNGKQVDHLKEVVPHTEPMPESELPAYFAHRDSLILKLHPVQQQSYSSNTNSSGKSASTSASNP